MADSLNDSSQGGTEDCQTAASNETIRCIKLQLPLNIVAYIEKRKLIRDEEITTPNSLAEKVTSNYIIAKEIISNLSWQEKMLAKLVCSTWLSAVHTLQREQLSPADFVMDLHTCCSSRAKINYKKSANFATEPLVVLTFANNAGFNITCKCKVVNPKPCVPSCDKEHCLLDLVERHVCAPKNCMLTVRAHYLSYMPLPESITYEHTITRHMFIRSNPFIGGVYIPQIPNVDFHVINIKSKNDMQQVFYSEVEKLSETRIFKGIIVYVTEKYLLQSVQDIVFLNYFKEVQPDIPYALGGCIVEDSMFEQNDINHIIKKVNEGNDFVTENLISIGIFSVPKSEDNNEVDKYNFEMYSLIIDTSDWAKSRIMRAITDFSKVVPRFEHSVAIKLSCLGRDQKHEVEQDYFRASFPQTRIVGCYGNGELGINHPARPPSDTANKNVKRFRSDNGPHYGIMYSYSTVFLYMGWGKSYMPTEATATLEKTRAKTQARLRTN